MLITSFLEKYMNCSCRMAASIVFFFEFTMYARIYMGSDW